MKNLFEISSEEKNRIRRLHESYKTVHGTTSLLTEQADRKLKGVVKDSETKEPVPFVNIYVTENNTNGTTSDVDGKFEISGIKQGQTVTISSVGYTNNVISDEIITSKQGSVSDFLLNPGIELEGVEVKAEREKVAGCMDPTAKNPTPKAWIDCKGEEFRDAKYTVEDGKEKLILPTSAKPDLSCCEYYEGCHEPTAKNYYKNDEELVNLEKEGKKIKACKKCCKKYSEGCKDPAALNYDENLDKSCKENKCCKYPKKQRDAINLVMKNFEQYYTDRLISAVINIYSNEKARDSRNIEKLLGNHKIDNKVPRPMRDSDGDWIGFAIPLQPDTEAIKRVREKISVARNEKTKRKLQNKLKELETNNVEIAVRFGPTILNRIMGTALAMDPDRWPRIKPEIYLRPSGSNKRGKKVYVGPESFNDIALTQRLVPFLLALNKQRDFVPKTTSDFDE